MVPSNKCVLNYTVNVLEMRANTMETRSETWFFVFREERKDLEMGGPSLPLHGKQTTSGSCDREQRWQVRALFILPDLSLSLPDESEEKKRNMIL